MAKKGIVFYPNHKVYRITTNVPIVPLLERNATCKVFHGLLRTQDSVDYAGRWLKRKHNGLSKAISYREAFIRRYVKMWGMKPSNHFTMALDAGAAIERDDGSVATLADLAREVTDAYKDR